MNWVSLGLFSAFLLAIVAVLDKRLLVVYITNIRTFYFLVGIVQVIIGIVVILINPWSSNLTYTSLLFAILSGLAWGIGLLILFYTVSKLEVSRVTTITHTYPVFVTIIAVIFLGDKILPLQAFAILITVIGAAMIASIQTKSSISSGSKFMYLLVVIVSFLAAINNISFKIGLEDIQFWDLFAFRSVVLGLILLAAGLHYRILQDLNDLVHSRNGLKVFIFTEGALAPIATITMFAALSLGPVSFVSTIISIRPFFVLLISGILSIGFFKFLDEPFTLKTLPVKLVSVILIFSGVTILTIRG